MPIHLCVLLWEHPGRGHELAAFEDEVLALLPEHGGRLISRHVVIERDDGDPLEVQVIEMPDEEIERVAQGPEADGWSEDDRVILRAADELHETSRFTDATWAALRARFNKAQLVELCAVVGQYHLLSYMINGLGVELHVPAAPFPDPTEVTSS